MRPRDRAALIREQIESQLARQKELDHHWDDQIDASHCLFLLRINHSRLFRMHIKLHLFPMRRACSSISLLRPPPLYLLIQTMILRNRNLDLLEFVLGEVVVYGWIAVLLHTAPYRVEGVVAGLHCFLPRMKMKTRGKMMKRSNG